MLKFGPADEEAILNFRLTNKMQTL